MNTEVFEKRYELKSALMVYADEQHKDFYLEIHKVIDGQLLEGKPFTADGLQKVVETYYNKEKQHSLSLLPTKILSMSNNVLMWFTPSEQRNLLFTDSLAIPDGKAYVPALLWVHERKTLKIYALMSDKRPQLRSRLYLAPFHNMQFGSVVCMGSAKLPSAAIEISKRMMACEQAFFGSRFSHIGEIVVTEKTNINLLWKELIETGKPFPKEVLLPAHIKTLGEEIKSLER